MTTSDVENGDRATTLGTSTLSRGGSGGEVLNPGVGSKTVAGAPLWALPGLPEEVSRRVWNPGGYANRAAGAAL